MHEERYGNQSQAFSTTTSPPLIPADVTSATVVFSEGSSLQPTFDKRVNQRDNAGKRRVRKRYRKKKSDGNTKLFSETNTKVSFDDKPQKPTIVQGRKPQKQTTMPVVGTSIEGIVRQGIQDHKLPSILEEIEAPPIDLHTIIKEELSKAETSEPKVTYFSGM
ncbi:uncharacterized protein LOC135712916 [Ochlerotatus camptorhynchus]|uniref:uncharacterized protein LOC135712916 n=1 Tax=Ochlerotatus camptorhynchus TaxID=644619 RepID=UPI0031E42B04